MIRSHVQSIQWMFQCQKEVYCRVVIQHLSSILFYVLHEYCCWIYAAKTNTCFGSSSHFFKGEHADSIRPTFILYSRKMKRYSFCTKLIRTQMVVANLANACFAIPVLLILSLSNGNLLILYFRQLKSLRRYYFNWTTAALIVFELYLLKTKRIFVIWDIFML